MTRHDLHKILEIPFTSRHAQGLQVFEWEHCAQSFQKISNELAMIHLIQTFKAQSRKDDETTVLLCESSSGAYYFGIGLKDCENITLEKLKELYNHGTWYVYTWDD